MSTRPLLWCFFLDSAVEASDDVSTNDGEPHAMELLVFLLLLAVRLLRGRV